MVRWHQFTPSDFEYDFERDKLAAHRISFEETVDVSSRILKCGAINLSTTATNSSGALGM
jgi:hypothetical protein